MKKQLLQETEIRKMMKFANIGALTDRFVDKLNETYETEPMTEQDEEEELDVAPEEPAPEMDMDMGDEAPEPMPDAGPEPAAGGDDVLAAVRELAMAADKVAQAAGLEPGTIEVVGDEDDPGDMGAPPAMDDEAPEADMDLGMDAAPEDEMPMEEEMYDDMDIGEGIDPQGRIRSEKGPKTHPAYDTPQAKRAGQGKGKLTVDEDLDEDLVAEVARRVSKRLLAAKR
jgi:hypothetical protein